jgi:hypothetical protein
MNPDALVFVGRGASKAHEQPGNVTTSMTTDCPGMQTARVFEAEGYGRYWARTSDLRLVEAALSQLS